jgi:hypothetical protein
VAALMAGCATPEPQTQSMRDPGADFAAFRTFALGAAPATGTDQYLQLLDQNIRAAIADQMRRRGYLEATDQPDLRMVYETTSAEKIESSPVRIGVGVGSWGGNVGGSVGMGSPSVRNYQEGTLVIHAVDNAKNTEVWQGRVSARLTKGSLEPAAVSRAVSTAMQDFPARPAGQ